MTPELKQVIRKMAALHKSTIECLDKLSLELLDQERRIEELERRAVDE